MTKDLREDIAYVRDGIDMEVPEREVRIRAVVLLPGDNKIDLVDFECEPDDIEQELIEHYGHSQFLYMAGPTCEWRMRHKYIDGLGESDVIKEMML